jgi:hypothetical protein
LVDLGVDVAFANQDAYRIDRTLAGRERCSAGLNDGDLVVSRRRVQ